MKQRYYYLLGRITLFIITGFFLTYRTYSQHLIFGNEKTKWEVGLNFGPSFFLGDLGGNAGKGATVFLKDLNLQFTKMMKGAFITMYPNKWLGLRVAADLTYLEGDDAVINTMGIDELWRKQRNLNFRTNVWEAYGSFELFPLMFLKRNSEYEPRLRPYVLFGLGIFHFNPQGSLTDANGNKSWYNLQPLKTEGEGMTEYPNSKPYNLTQMNIPVGGGLKFYISERFNFGAELLYRKTFTDYIDDVSKNYIDAGNFIKYMPAQNAALATQLSDKTIGIIYPGMTRWEPGAMRGDKKQSDTYFSVVLKLGIQLGQVYDNSYDRRAARQTRCPVVY